MDTVVLSWEDKFGLGSSPGSGILSSGLPSTSNLGIASALSLWWRYWVL